MDEAETASEENDDLDYESPYADPTVGLLFLEKLCLAIIRAHPPTKDYKQNEAQRLRAAMYALKPDYYRHGKHDADDRLLLYWMAAQWLLKHGGVKVFDQRGIRILKAGPALFGENEPRVIFEDVRELAKAALIRFGEDPRSDLRAPVKRLLEKFEDESIEEKIAKWQEFQEQLDAFAKLTPEERAKQPLSPPALTKREQLLASVSTASPNPHVEDHRLLMQVVDLLRAAEVPAEKPKEPSAF